MSDDGQVPQDSSGPPPGVQAGPAGGGEVGSRLAQLSRELQQQESPQEVMDRVVRAAVTLVPGAQDARISRVEGRRRMVSTAATSDRARRVDQLQDETGQGP